MTELRLYARAAYAREEEAIRRAVLAAALGQRGEVNAIRNFVAPPAPSASDGPTRADLARMFGV